MWGDCPAGGHSSAMCAAGIFTEPCLTGRYQVLHLLPRDSRKACCSDAGSTAVVVFSAGAVERFLWRQNLPSLPCKKRFVHASIFCENDKEVKARCKLASTEQAQERASTFGGKGTEHTHKLAWKETRQRASNVDAGAPPAASELKRLCQEGRLKEALAVLDVMDQQGVVAPVDTYWYLLQRCCKKKALDDVKRVHAHMVRSSLCSNSYLGNFIVSVYVTCGSLADALEVFNRVTERTTVSWTALIVGYTKGGQGREALRLYEEMKKSSVRPDKYTFSSILKACGSLGELEECRRLHEEVVKSGCESDIYVGTTLVDMYAKCGSMVDARRVFHNLIRKDVVSWNAMISGYVQQGQAEEALQLYKEMQEQDMKPNHRTFPSLLKACGILAAKEKETLEDGQQTRADCLQKVRNVHVEIIRGGYDSDPFVANTLVNTYAKCGNMIEARHLFNKVLQRDVVLWNVLIAGYVQQQQFEEAFQMYAEMQREGVGPDDWTFASVLKACSSLTVQEGDTLVDGIAVRQLSLRMGKEIHAEVVRRGYESVVFLANTLVHMYAKCGSLVDARQVFDSLPQRDVVSWTALIGGYVQQGQNEEAMHLYDEMREEGVRPNNLTFVSVLKACGSLAATEDGTCTGQSLKLMRLQKGKEIHAEVHRSGHAEDVILGTALIDMYAKCGDLREARRLFDQQSSRDVVTWTALIGGYADQDEGGKALQLYSEMRAAGVKPNSWTFVSALRACGSMACREDPVLVDGQLVKPQSLQNGKEIHKEVVKFGYESDAFVGAALVYMYGKCGNLLDARRVFGRLSERDVVSWNIMIAGYGEEGQADTALQLYHEMVESGLRADEVTLLGLLKACANAGSSNMCSQIHELICKSGMEGNVSLATSLIHAYGRCSRMGDARRVFDSFPKADVALWNALIAGYARQGECSTCFQCFKEMQEAGMKPNQVSFLSVLAACSHAGMVDRSIQYLDSMTRDYGITPKLEHYTCIVDLFGRAGLLNKVEELISQMPMQPDIATWLCVLGACRMHNNIDLGRRAFESAIKLDPKCSSAYLLMSSIYSQAGMSADANKLEDLRQQAGAWKTPGQSWIEHDNTTHKFLVGDASSPNPQLYQMLKLVNRRLESSRTSHSFIKC